jgi:Short C-terminal domain
MFWRKRKREEDNLGLSAPYVSPSSTDLSISVSPGAAPGSAPDPAAAQPQNQTPFPLTAGMMGMGTGTGAGPGAAGMPTNVPALLGQILGGNGPVGELIAEIKKDPEAFRARMMQQAQAAGVSTYVLTPQGMTQMGGPGGPTGAGVTPMQQPQHVDVIDELTKAAALHDKGALTDAEFEALKKKLLGE